MPYGSSADNSFAVEMLRFAPPSSESILMTGTISSAVMTLSAYLFILLEKSSMSSLLMLSPAATACPPKFVSSSSLSESASKRLNPDMLLPLPLPLPFSSDISIAGL